MDTPLKQQFALEKAKFKAQIELKKKMHKGDPGYTPIKGKDYFTANEIAEIRRDVLSLIPKPKDGVSPTIDYNKILTACYTKVAEHVAKIKPIKGDKGDKGDKGKDAVVDIDALVRKVLVQIPKQKDKKYVIDREQIIRLIDEHVKKNPPQTVRIGGSVASIRALTDVILDGVPQDAQGNYILTPGGGPGGAVDSVNGQTGTVVLDADDIDDASTSHKFASSAQLTKIDFISVTQPVDIDQMELDIAALANGMVYKGNWDSSAGTFPGAGVAKTGWFYYVSVGGTVDGIEFTIGDNIVATVNNASTTTYAANWSKHDQTDAVQAVAGLIGNISASALKTALTLVKADVGLGNIDNTSDANKPVSTAQQTALNLKQDTSVIAATAMGVVVHGATAGTARPTGFAQIHWIGSVEPTNMANGDIWSET